MADRWQLIVWKALLWTIRRLKMKKAKILSTHPNKRGVTATVETEQAKVSYYLHGD
jgi:hypothetical protein